MPPGPGIGPRSGALQGVPQEEVPDSEWGNAERKRSEVAVFSSFPPLFKVEQTGKLLADMEKVLDLNHEAGGAFT